jgi:hypothetical protein
MCWTQETFEASRVPYLIDDVAYATWQGCHVGTHVTWF